jgi:hypothetical protein
MRGRLVVRPRPLAGEGLRGYLLRLREENGLPLTVDLRRSIFVSAAAPGVMLEGQRASIDDACDLPRELAAGWSAVEGRHACLFGGHRIAVAHLRGRRCAVCPRCLAGVAALRAVWDLGATSVCATHGCWLIDVCPSCGDSLSWRRSSVVRCECGYDLRHTKVVRAPSPVCALMKIVEERLSGELSTRAGAESGFPDELDRMRVNQLLALFHLLDNVRLSEVVEEPPEIDHASRDLMRRAAVGLRLAEALSDWPRGWQRLQSQVNAAHFGTRASERHLVSKDEAVAPFRVLERDVDRSGGLSPIAEDGSSRVPGAARRPDWSPPALHFRRPSDVRIRSAKAASAPVVIRGIRSGGEPSFPGRGPGCARGDTTPVGHDERCRAIAKGRS